MGAPGCSSLSSLSGRKNTLNAGPAVAPLRDPVHARRCYAFATKGACMREFHVNRQDLRRARVAQTAVPPLAAGAARLRLDLFALTSNNITYAAMGESFAGYWDFFPGPDGWGRPPVWGFGTVVASNAAGVEEGARYFGFFPLSETLDVTPARIGARGFMDGAPHRAPKAAVYNQYVSTAADSTYDAEFEPEQALFRPLYPSGWWAADCAHQGAPRAVVISSASSKTALATAHQLRRLGSAELVALTSARNKDYVRDTALHDRVLTYDEVATLSAQVPATYVDFLGRDELNAAVHRTLGAKLAHSILIGATDWSDKPGGVQPPKGALAGPSPEVLFVPDYAAERLKADRELGAALQRDLRAFYPASRAYVTARRMAGVDAILQSWARLADGEVPPREGLVLSF
jgi:hypothetical protein